MKKHLMIAALATLVVPSAFAAGKDPVKNTDGFFRRTGSAVGGAITGTPSFIKRQTWDGKRRYITGTAVVAVGLALAARQKLSGSVRALYNRALGRVCSSCPSKK